MAANKSIESGTTERPNEGNSGIEPWYRDNTVIFCETFPIARNKAGMIIGRGGSNVRCIQSTFMVRVKVNREGNRVSVSGDNLQSIRMAVDYIREWIREPAYWRTSQIIHYCQEPQFYYTIDFNNSAHSSFDQDSLENHPSEQHLLENGSLENRSPEQRSLENRSPEQRSLDNRVYPLRYHTGWRQILNVNIHQHTSFMPFTVTRSEEDRPN